MFYDISRDTSPAVRRNRTFARLGVILHTSDGSNSVRWLQGLSAADGHPVSSDFLVRRNGDVLRIVGREEYAFHAGQSRYKVWEGDAVNQRFLGIELENLDTAGEEPTDAQYNALGGALHELLWSGELPRNYMLFGHGQLALPCGRRCDPVRFDWGRIVWPR